jgi:hypothetical protein|tara:strand:+ start:816 stop:1046 length:231 start_codon:yes stop_codon:yes gene_type:complete
MDDDILKINCTTIITIRNTKTGYVYKDDQEKDSDINNPNTETKADHVVQDLRVQVSSKGLNLLQKVMNKNNDKPKP